MSSNLFDVDDASLEYAGAPSGPYRNTIPSSAGSKECCLKSTETQLCELRLACQLLLLPFFNAAPSTCITGRLSAAFSELLLVWLFANLDVRCGEVCVWVRGIDDQQVRIR